MIVLSVNYASSVLQKTKGLIGKKKPYPLFFKTRWGIHTFGLSFPIDVLILDSTYTVRFLKKSMPKNSIFVWNPRFNMVIELPAGSIKKHQIKHGEKIQLKII